MTLIPAMPAIPAVQSGSAGSLVGFSADEITAAQQTLEQSLAPNTWATYRSGWRRYLSWCATRSVAPLPATADTLVMFLTLSAALTRPDGKPRFKASTLDVTLVAIRQMHHAAHITPNPADDDLVKRAMAGIRRSRDESPRRVAPLLTSDIITIVNAMPFQSWPAGLSSIRDAAIILVGFAGAFRRSELEARTVADLTVQPDGLRVRLSRSKTNQEGRAAEFKAIPYGQHPTSCPVCAVHHWLALVNLADSGADRPALMRSLIGLDRSLHVCRNPLTIDPDDPRPLFRQIPRGQMLPPFDPTHPTRDRLSGGAIYRMLLRRIEAAGYTTDAFGGHSLRAGFITQALNAGADSLSIRRQTGHKSDAMLQVYDREQNLFTRNAATTIGL